MAKGRSSPTRRHSRKETSVLGIMREMRAGIKQLGSEQAARSESQSKQGIDTKGKRPFRVRRFVIILLVGAGLLFASFYGLDYLVKPWAHSWPGHKALIGYWQGEITFGSGDMRQVALRMTTASVERPLGDGGGGGVGDSTPKPDLEGEAKICGPQGNTNYEITGDVKNRQGTNFQIGFGTQADGLHPDATAGTWDGQDSLQMQTRLYSQTASQAAGSVSTVPGGAESGAIRFEMRRIDAASFNGACA